MGYVCVGVGAGVTAAVVADLTRVTLESDRTGTLSIFIALFSVGQVIGEN